MRKWEPLAWWSCPGNSDVGGVGVAHRREVVPLVHGIDSLGLLGAARLVDAARVDPNVAIAVLPCDDSGIPDLG